MKHLFSALQTVQTAYAERTFSIVYVSTSLGHLDFEPILVTGPAPHTVVQHLTDRYGMNVRFAGHLFVLNGMERNVSDVCKIQ